MCIRDRYLCHRHALVPGPIPLPTLVTVLAACEYSVDPGMWIAEVPILSNSLLMPLKGRGSRWEVHRYGCLWHHGPSLGFLVCVVLVVAACCLGRLKQFLIAWLVDRRLVQDGLSCSSFVGSKSELQTIIIISIIIVILKRFLFSFCTPRESVAFLTATFVMC